MNDLQSSSSQAGRDDATCWPPLAAMVAALGLLALAAWPHRPLVVWNASASAPIGLYRVGREPSLQRGDLVVVTPPAALAAYLDQRGYLPRGVPLVKQIAATPGDTVCRHGALVSRNGAPVAIALASDRRGRALPVWRGCIRLAAGHVLLLNPVRDSLDGRYFGPTATTHIIGRARLLRRRR